MLLCGSIARYFIKKLHHCQPDILIKAGFVHTGHSCNMCKGPVVVWAELGIRCCVTVSALSHSGLNTIDLNTVFLNW